MEALRLAHHKRFGKSSEKSEDTLVEQLSFLFNEAEVFAEVKTAENNVTVVAAHKRHKKHGYALETIPEDIPKKQVEHRLEAEDLVCPQCGDIMTEIGKEVVRTLEIIPAQVLVREDIYYTYACKSCTQKDTETPVVKAPKEKNIIPGSFAAPEAIAHIMTQKFVMASPLYRQEQETNRRGIRLSRQTMSNWILRNICVPFMSSCTENFSSERFFMRMRLCCRYGKKTGERQLYVAVPNQRRHGQGNCSI